MLTSSADSESDLDFLEERLRKDEYEHRIEELKREIEAEIRRRLVADRGVEAMAKHSVNPFQKMLTLCTLAGRRW
ncbi:MAG: hypothetical protein CM15mP49_03470 [Actinomycetota bacterium]|nr:MAG: hypothetical protein CM15mP49_03470 [Actinomycetota bacterium]